MTPKSARSLKLVTLAATLWIIYLLPWPGSAWIDPGKPAITAIAFAVLSWRFGVGSWPLTIVFSLTFFFYSIADLNAHSLGPTSDLAGADTETRHVVLYIGTMLFSPFTLWAPVLFGALAYALVGRLRSNNRRGSSTAGVQEGS